MARTVEFDMSELEARCAELGQRARAFPLAILGELLKTHVDNVLQSEGRGMWPGFEDSTLERHPIRIGGKLLQWKGELAALQSSHAYDWAEVVSPAPYAKYHITGTHNRDGTWRMSPRDFMDIDQEAYLHEAIEAVLAEIAP